MVEREAEHTRSDRWWTYAPIRNPSIAGLMAATAWMLGKADLLSRGMEDGVYWVAIVLAAYLWVCEGLGVLLRSGEVGIPVLMIAATVGTGVLGLWEEGAALAVLYGIAEGVEERTFERTRRAIRALLDLAPKQARLVMDGAPILVPASSLKLGDRFLVKPGEAVATDGIILEGRSSLDESTITGEAVAVDKTAGAMVYAGALNGPGALSVEVTAPYSDNTLSRIIHLVERAQKQKGRAQQWIERFGRWYSPSVLVAAALLLFVPWSLGHSAGVWGTRAVVLLVAAAPCALVISLPIVMAAGIALAGRRGILIKGGAHLENLGKVRTIAFDKTGTLTHGRPNVTDVVSTAVDEPSLLAAAAGLEQNSEHPLGRAIHDFARKRGIEPAETADFAALAGAGVRASIGQTTWYVGSPAFFRDRGHDLFEIDGRVQDLEAEGKTVVVIGNDRQIGGFVALQDTIRPRSARLIADLHAANYRTVLLTGDNPSAAARVGERLGINDVRAALKPGDKAAAVRELDSVDPVLMVGDGVNDAPALATATCGVAMGAAGTDAAIEAADIALMSDDLGKLGEALHLGRRARRISRQNVVFSLLVLVTLVPLAVSGVLSVAIAVIVHEASELLAIANGLRAGRIDVHWLKSDRRKSEELLGNG